MKSTKLAKKVSSVPKKSKKVTNSEHSDKSTALLSWLHINKPAASPSNSNKSTLISPSNSNKPVTSPSNLNKTATSPSNSNKPATSPSNSNKPATSPSNSNKPATSPSNTSPHIFNDSVLSLSISNKPTSFPFSSNSSKLAGSPSNVNNPTSSLFIKPGVSPSNSNKAAFEESSKKTAKGKVNHPVNLNKSTKVLTLAPCNDTKLPLSKVTPPADSILKSKSVISSKFKPPCQLQDKSTSRSSKETKPPKKKPENVPAHPKEEQVPSFKSALSRDLYSLYNRECFDDCLPKDMMIGWNIRLRRTGGRCYPRRLKDRAGVEHRSARIELSTKVIDSCGRLEEALLHEMCHAAAWISQGEREGHGPVWRAWADKARGRFPGLAVMDSCHSYSIRTKFTYKCCGCGYSVGRHSKSLNTDRQVCGHCKNKFQLVVNYKGKVGAGVWRCESKRGGGVYCLSGKHSKKLK